MRILSIDPGLTTGIALIDDGLFIFGMLAIEDMIMSTDFFNQLAKMSTPDVVIVEKPPQAARFNTHTHQEIYIRTLRWFRTADYRVVTINPGQWKHLIVRSKADSVHIRDATDMARWFYGKEIENVHRA